MDCNDYSNDKLYEIMARHGYYLPAVSCQW